jgi:hypothetical protein
LKLLRGEEGAHLEGEGEDVVGDGCGGLLDILLGGGDRLYTGRRR